MKRLLTLLLPLLLMAATGDPVIEPAKDGLSHSGQQFCAPNSCGPQKHWFVLGSSLQVSFAADTFSTLIWDDKFDTVDNYKVFRFPADVMVTNSHIELNATPGGGGTWAVTPIGIGTTYGTGPTHVITSSLTSSSWSGEYWVAAGSGWRNYWNETSTANSTAKPSASISGWISPPGGMDFRAPQGRHNLMMLGGVDNVGHTGDFYNSPGNALDTNLVAERFIYERAIRLWRYFAHLEGAPGAGITAWNMELTVNGALQGDYCLIIGVTAQADANCWAYGPWDVPAAQTFGLFVDKVGSAAATQAVVHSFLASFQGDENSTLIYANGANSATGDFAITPFAQATLSSCASSVNGQFHVPEDMTATALYANVNPDPGADGVGFDVQLWVDGSAIAGCSCELRGVAGVFDCFDSSCDADIDLGESVCVLLTEVGSAATPTTFQLGIEVQKR